MSMPLDLLFLRHGQSEGNLAIASNGDGEKLFTDRFMTTPGHLWRLTPEGVLQAQVMGKHIESLGLDFDRFFVSPFVRTRETAAYLGLGNASWRLNRAVRERSWGDIGSQPESVFESKPEYALNAKLKKVDPLYWTAPNGESLADVAQNRALTFVSSLSRSSKASSVLVVTHEEFMQAMRLTVERMSDEGFMALLASSQGRFHNCELLHYSRVDPFSGEVCKDLCWMRRSYPSPDGEVVVGSWVGFKSSVFDNTELLDSVSDVPYIF